MTTSTNSKFKEVKHEPEPKFVKYYYVALVACSAFLAYAVLTGGGGH